MLDRHDVDALLKTFRYKPSWEFETDAYSSRDSLFIRVTMRVLDANQDYPSYPDLIAYVQAQHGLYGGTVAFPSREDMGQTRYVNLTPSKAGGLLPIPWPVLEHASLAEPKRFWDWLIYDAITQLEQHEIYEWARVNGVCHRDPHPEKTKGAEL